MRRRCTLAIIVLWVVVFSASMAVSAQKTTITFGVPWGLDVFEGVLLELVDAYNAQSQTVQVEIETGWDRDKLVTAAAGGAGPDVIGFDGPSTVRAIGEVVLRPIDAEIDRHGIDLNRFFPDSVTQIRGQTYTLKLFVDPNFPLIYNDTFLQEAGVAMPPRSIPELDEVFPKLTRRTADGQAERVAMLPWNLGDEHLFLTWGPAFGATKIWDGDETSGRFVLSTPEWRSTFDWIIDYYHRIVPDIGHWGDRAWWNLDWLIEGRIAMAYHVSPTLGRLKATTPYTWKIAPPLSGPSGVEMPIWFGGFTFGVGKFTQNEEAAFDFLRFLIWDAQASEIIGSAGLIGAYQGAAAHDVLLENNPEWAEFISLLPRAFGNLYIPPQVRFGERATEFMNAIKAGASVPNALAELERVVNAEAAEVDMLRE